MKERNSSFELLRLVSMWMIVFYHFHYHALAPSTGEAVFRAVQLPLHIGVLNFVLISGYFNIRLSLRGFCSFAAKVVFYALAVWLAASLIWGGSCTLHTLGDNLFVFSWTKLWFIRTYAALMLFAPFANKLLAGQTPRQRLALVGSLAFACIYLGLMGEDTAMRNGKNLANFLLLYAIGDSIRTYDLASLLRRWQWCALWIGTSVVVGGAYFLWPETLAGDCLWLLSYGYNSPLLFLMAVLCFMVFARTRFTSKAVNAMAASVFAVYLIHENPNLNTHLYDLVQWLYDSLPHGLAYALLAVMACLVMILCIAVDKATQPLQRAIAVLLERVGKKLSV